MYYASITGEQSLTRKTLPCSPEPDRGDVNDVEPAVRTNPKTGAQSKDRTRAPDTVPVPPSLCAVT
jgi:hypothetical protein